MRTGQRAWLMALLVASHGCGRANEQGTSTSGSASLSASSSASVAGDPVDAYCDGIEAEWQGLDRLCTVEQRATADYEQARAAVTAAVTECKALLRPSLAQGRLGFEKKAIRLHDYGCLDVFKYEWGALAALTRFQSNCSPTKVAGLVSNGSPCSFSFECRSQVCDKRSDGAYCVAPLEEGADCTGVDATAFDPIKPCASNLFCDREPSPARLAGYPPGSTTRRSDFPIRPGKVVVEAVAEGSAPKPDIAQWAGECHPRLVRCFEAALAADANAHGSLMLDVVRNRPAQLGASDVPGGLRDCAARAAWGTSLLKGPARVRIVFTAPAEKKPAKLPARSGKCKKTGIVGDSCELASDCLTRVCRDWKCEYEGAEPEACRTDDQCSVTHHCVLGICTPRNWSGGPCSASADCFAGTCEAGICRAMCASKLGPRFDPD